MFSVELMRVSCGKVVEKGKNTGWRRERGWNVRQTLAANKLFQLVLTGFFLI